MATTKQQPKRVQPRPQQPKPPPAKPGRVQTETSSPKVK